MRRFEIGISLFLIATSIVAIWQSLLLPAGTFDALGSAGFPLVIASGTGILSIFILVRAGFGRLAAANQVSDRPDQVSDTSPTHRTRNDLALKFAALTFFYVMALALELSSFGILTALFLYLALSLLTGFTRKSLAPNILVAVILGFGCEILFTQVFAIDLP